MLIRRSTDRGAQAGAARRQRYVVRVTRLRDQPVVTALLPVGSGRRAAAAALVRRVAPSTTRRPSAKRPEPVREEERRLRKVWDRHDPKMLDIYLVSGFQDPRINVQSILGRHTLVRALFGSAYDDVMRDELTWAVELNEAIRVRAGQLGVSLVATMDPERQAGVQRVMGEFDERAGTYAKRWREALSGRRARRLRVVELACGSANDYRAIADYGLARFLDYTGIDLNAKNIDNARKHFPNVDFRVGSILELPIQDRSVDYVLAFDIFEHLSLSAMQVALNEAVRVSRRGLYFAFFRMADVPEHVEEPRGQYHYNLLSASRIREYLDGHYPSVEVLHISGLLRERFGYEHSYNSRAYSVVAERPRPAPRLLAPLIARARGVVPARRA
jgi:ubiquinone/menaquinone biosynthesis C-methylase UbiE